jgi:DNA repair photolyase
MPDQLIGIAKIAHSAPTLESKLAVEYRQLESFKLLGRCSSPRMPFEWTLNPYRGCEIGCKYCYARYTHEFMELRDPADFERIIFAKRWNRADFLRDLRRVPAGERIAIGTATDPYQPAERRFGITRSVLEAIATQRGLRIAITTKSDLVIRDIDLLREIGKSNEVSVQITVTTVDADLARKLEPRAPRPDLRLAAVRKLSDAGIHTGIFGCPMLPLINDREAQLDALGAAARQAGAQFISAQAVFLMPSALKVFLPFLEAEFPHLVRRYRERFEKNAFLRGDYPDRLRSRIAAVRKKYGLVNEPAARAMKVWPEEPQLSLFPEALEGPRTGERLPAVATVNVAGDVARRVRAKECRQFRDIAL